MNIAQDTFGETVRIEASISVVRHKVEANKARLVATELADHTICFLKLAPTVQRHGGRYTDSVLQHVVGIVAPINLIKVLYDLLVLHQRFKKLDEVLVRTSLRVQPKVHLVEKESAEVR